MNKSATGPLEGIKVLDFTWVLAGPHATKILRDLGADVIKVEAFKNGAVERNYAHPVVKDGVKQVSFNINVNRGKKSLCINLKHPKGMALIHDLIRRSDVVIENFATGVMSRLKLDYESVKKVKEDIVYCSIASFGQTGPYSHKPGYDIIAQAASGLIAQMEPPIQSPIAVGDTIGSMHALPAILAALIHRKKTGQGQYIDIGLVDCLFAMHENTLPRYLLSSAIGKPVPPPRFGKHHSEAAPYGVYQGKDGYAAIALLDDAHWPALLKVLGPFGEALKGSAFTKAETRCTPENCAAVHQAVENWVMSLDSVAEAEKILNAAGIAGMRVRSVEELVDTEPHIKDREMIVTIDQPFLGPMRMYGSPLKFSESPAGPQGYGPFLGEHNREVLMDALGLEQAEVDALYKEDVLYHEPCVDRLATH